jgi:hypothetical protein
MPRRSWRRTIKEGAVILEKIWRKVKAITNRIHRFCFLKVVCFEMQ